MFDAQSRMVAILEEFVNVGGSLHLPLIAVPEVVRGLPHFGLAPG